MLISYATRYRPMTCTLCYIFTFLKRKWCAVHEHTTLFHKKNTKEIKTLVTFRKNAQTGTQPPSRKMSWIAHIFCHSSASCLSPHPPSPSPHLLAPTVIPALTLVQVARRHKATETNGSAWKQLNAEIYLGKQRYVCVTGHYVLPSTYLQPWAL